MKPLDPARWSRLAEAVADACAGPVPQRAERLRAALGDDAELLAEGEALLGAEDRAALLDPPAAVERSDPWLGRRFDRWRTTALLGAGGMGRVYAAERVDAPFEQRVALKVLNVALADPTGRERFMDEQRALARLEHPGIARLIDAGSTGEGVPYLVLERVDGQPIDRWCDERALGLRERVRLFLGACEALELAHHSLVLHLDVKPSNVLVDSTGRPRLVDFGVARLLDREPRAPAQAHALTPRYASPELARGGPVTTASDVYSLGVLLHEILVGRAPYVVTGRDPAEIESAVRAARPERPSDAVGRGDPKRAAERAAHRGLSVTRLARALAGDLDAIVLRALAKDPLARYPGPAALREDLERWLAGFPVHARGITPLHRLARFVRRNAFGVGATAALAAALAVGFLSTLHQYRAARAAEADERAQRELADARLAEAQELVRTLVYGVHDKIARLPGATPVRLFLVERTRAHLDALARGGIGDTLIDEVAATYLRLGEVQGARSVGSVGDVAGAIESTSRARDLLREALSTRPDDAQLRLRCAGAERQLGDLLRTSGRPAEALERYARQRELAEEVLATTPASRDAGRELALALGQTARVHLDFGRPGKALADLDRALAMAAALAAAHPDDSALRSDLLLRGNQRGSALLALGRREAALAQQRETLAAARALALEHPDDTGATLALLVALLHAAEAEHATGDSAVADRLATEALALAELAAGADSESTVPAGYRVQANEQLGDIATTCRRGAEARGLFERGAEVARWRHERSLGDQQAGLDFARLTLKAADAAAKLGAGEDARAGYEEALAVLMDAKLDRSDPRVLEIVFAAELGLVDLDRADGTGDGAEALERLLVDSVEHGRLFTELEWPIRNRGLVAWRLGGMQEALGHTPARPRPERRRALERARELYVIGLEMALALRDRAALSALEADVVEAFEADVARCDSALAEL